MPLSTLARQLIFKADQRARGAGEPSTDSQQTNTMHLALVWDDDVGEHGGLALLLEHAELEELIMQLAVDYSAHRFTSDMEEWEEWAHDDQRVNLFPQIQDPALRHFSIEMNEKYAPARIEELLDPAEEWTHDYQGCELVLGFKPVPPHHDAALCILRRTDSTAQE